MSYSTDPVYDAQRHCDERDSYEARIEASQQMLTANMRAAMTLCDPSNIELGRRKSYYRTDKENPYCTREEFLHETLMDMAAWDPKFSSMAVEALLTAAKANHPASVRFCEALALQFGLENASAE